MRDLDNLIDHAQEPAQVVRQGLVAQVGDAVGFVAVLRVARPPVQVRPDQELGRQLQEPIPGQLWQVLSNVPVRFGNGFRFVAIVALVGRRRNARVIRRVHVQQRQPDTVEPEGKTVSVDTGPRVRHHHLHLNISMRNRSFSWTLAAADLMNAMACGRVGLRACRTSFVKEP